MPIKDPDNVNWYVVIYLFIITALGSLANYFYNVLKGNKFRIGILIAQMLISAFTGALAILAASYFDWRFELAGGIAGLAGWSGATLIKTLEEKLIKHTKGDKQQ